MARAKKKAHLALKITCFGIASLVFDGGCGLMGQAPLALQVEVLGSKVPVKDAQERQPKREVLTVQGVLERIQKSLRPCYFPYLLREHGSKEKVLDHLLMADFFHPELPLISESAKKVLLENEAQNLVFVSDVLGLESYLKKTSMERQTTMISQFRGMVLDEFLKTIQEKSTSIPRFSGLLMFQMNRDSNANLWPEDEPLPSELGERKDVQLLSYVQGKWDFRSAWKQKFKWLQKCQELSLLTSAYSLSNEHQEQRDMFGFGIEPRLKLAPINTLISSITLGLPFRYSKMPEAFMGSSHDITYGFQARLNMHQLSLNTSRWGQIDWGLHFAYFEKQSSRRAQSRSDSDTLNVGGHWLLHCAGGVKLKGYHQSSEKQGDMALHHVQQLDHRITLLRSFDILRLPSLELGLDYAWRDRNFSKYLGGRLEESTRSQGLYGQCRYKQIQWRLAWRREAMDQVHVSSVFDAVAKKIHRQNFLVEASYAF